MDTAPLPALPPLLCLAAVDRTRNIARRYEIEWGCDLLGDWVVVTRWGRIGARGRSKTEVYRTEYEAARRAGEHLGRRASAEGRIGTPYGRIFPRASAIT